MTTYEEKTLQLNGAKLIASSAWDETPESVEFYTFLEYVEGDYNIKVVHSRLTRKKFGEFDPVSMVGPTEHRLSKLLNKYSGMKNEQIKTHLKTIQLRSQL